MLTRIVSVLGCVLAISLAFADSCASLACADEPAGEKVEKSTEHAKEGTGEKGAENASTEHAPAHGKAHAAGHGEHDLTDLSEANGTPSIADPAEIKFDMAIFSFVVFLLVLIILTKFAWKPIAHGLEAREKGIEDKIEQARLAAEKATEQLKAYEARLAAATQEAQQIVGEARKTAETAKEKILAEAQALAQREREKAVADITAAKNLALREIAEKSVDTAIGLARNIIRREVRPGDHEQLIKDALQQFPHN
jgi:F-type H+-transporting ATPase subunit b